MRVNLFLWSSWSSIQGLFYRKRGMILYPHFNSNSGFLGFRLKGTSVEGKQQGLFFIFWVQMSLEKMRVELTLHSRLGNLWTGNRLKQQETCKGRHMYSALYVKYVIICNCLLGNKLYSWKQHHPVGSICKFNSRSIGAVLSADYCGPTQNVITRVTSSKH